MTPSQKLAQTASAATALPPVWSKELMQLQDAMPADPPDVVERILAEELGAGSGIAP